MAAFDGGAFIWSASRDAASGWIHSSMVIRGRGVIIQLQDARLRRHEGGPRRQLCLLVRSDAACRHGGLRGARDPRLEPTGLTGDSGKPGLRQGPEAWGLRGGLANRLTLRSRRVRPPDGSTVGGGGPCLGGSNAGPALTHLLPALARRRSGDRRFCGGRTSAAASFAVVTTVCVLHVAPWWWWTVASSDDDVAWRARQRSSQPFGVISRSLAAAALPSSHSPHLSSPP